MLVQVDVGDSWLYVYDNDVIARSDSTGFEGKEKAMT